MSTVAFGDSTGHFKVFDLTSPNQMLQKLRWETDLIKSMLPSDTKVVFAAFNAAATAWHLTEWVTDSSNFHAPKMGASAYRKDVTTRCPELETCRQISVGWKHRVVGKRNDPSVVATHLISISIKSDLSAPPSKIERAPVIFINKKSHKLDDFFERVTSFWTDELQRIGVNPDVII